MVRHIRSVLILTLFALYVSCNNSVQSDAGEQPTIDTVNTGHKKTELLSNHPLLTWLRKNPAEIGCMLEKEINFRDSVFNCNYGDYSNNGDPCDNITEYYEGINIPEDVAPKIDEAIKEIVLDFEHGSLREIRITFQDSLLKKNIAGMFDLPTKKKDLPDNILSIKYGENVYSKEKPTNPDYTRWLTITAFDHTGAGEVDCD